MPRRSTSAPRCPHGAVRAYVMGERGARNEEATPDDIAAMAGDRRRRPSQAGALGFSTSRTILHRAMDGELVPGTFAAEDELLGIGAAARRGRPRRVRGGHRDLAIRAERRGRVDAAALAEETGPARHLRLPAERPSQPSSGAPARAARRGRGRRAASITPQVARARPACCWASQSTVHPFVRTPAYRDIAALPLAERVAKLRDPAVRAAILADPTQATCRPAGPRSWPSGFAPDVPARRPARLRAGARGQSIAAIAEREGRRPARGRLRPAARERRRAAALPARCSATPHGDLDAIREMMLHPQAPCSGSPTAARTAA